MADGRSQNSYESLGSSNSCLDGVPFKIGPKFQPPDKIHVPKHFLEHSKCQLLEEEYLFQTEEGVLAWIRAKEETRRQQKREAEERKAKEIEQFAQNTVKNEESSDESDNDSAKNNLNTSQLVVNPTRPTFDSILTPTPIYSNIANKPPADTITKTTTDIDLTWFEKENDAFENLDLQTIDDMAELKNVFQDSRAFNASPSNAPQQVNYSTGTCSTDSSAKPTTSVAAPNTDVPVARPRKIYPNFPTVTSSESAQKVEEGDYVNLMVDLNQHHVTFQNKNSQKKTHTTGAVLGGGLPTHMATSGLYKPVLPPIHNLPQIGLKSTLHGLNGISNDKTNMGCHNDFTFPMSNSPPAIGGHQSINDQSITYENLKDVRLRSAKSNPDLSEYPEPNVSSSFSASRTPPPLPQRSIPDQKIYENVLVSKPLPPVPSSKPRPVSCSSGVNSSVQHVPDRQESRVYSTLSVKDQQFVCKLGSMGFPRERLSRAVAQLGQDEKEVIDLLCHVDTLVGRGYPPMKTEAALFLFKNNVNKAAEYIDSFDQFQELGFDADKIREALIRHNVDREKALDELTTM